MSLLLLPLLPLLLLLSQTCAANDYGDGNATFFSPRRALLFAHFSNAAYCDAAAISAWDCKPCLQADPNFRATKVIQGKTGGTQVFIGSVPQPTGDIVVSFRGSSNFANWMKNLDFPKTTAYPKCAPGCKVHEGFWSAWEEIAAEVLAEVERLAKLQPSARIFVTGHSLGAALAALCAADLGAAEHSLGYPIEGVYSYGQPRTGNTDFANFYQRGEHVSWRITHWRDIVPNLPLKAMGFHHTSTEVFYNEDSTVWQLCDGTGEDDACADQFHIPSVDDHLKYLNVSISHC